MSEKLLIDSKEVAEVLGVSLRKLEQMILDGNAPEYIRLGRIRKWRTQDVHDWINKLYQQSILKKSDE